MTINSEEVREAIAEPMSTIIEAVRISLERCPPELSADLVDRGMILAGGGSLLRGLDKLLGEETGLPVNVADEPIESVVLGTGKVLQELRFLKRIVVTEKSGF